MAISAQYEAISLKLGELRASGSGKGKRTQKKQKKYMKLRVVDVYKALVAASAVVKAGNKGRLRRR